MNKRAILGLTTTVFLLIAIAGSNNHSAQPNTSPKPESGNTQDTASTNTQPAAETKPICDGTAVTANCTVDGVTYTTYIYHPAVPEKSHVQTNTTYQKKLTGYCTLCNDGTYSPSCATGRGACSWHSGVQEWNAPMYSTSPVTTAETVIDAPAQDAYYDKVAAQ